MLPQQRALSITLPQRLSFDSRLVVAWAVVFFPWLGCVLVSLARSFLLGGKQFSNTTGFSGLHSSPKYAARPLDLVPQLHNRSK
jgi:hypothetical protein